MQITVACSLDCLIAWMEIFSYFSLELSQLFVPWNVGMCDSWRVLKPNNLFYLFLSSNKSGWWTWWVPVCIGGRPKGRAWRLKYHKNSRWYWNHHPYLILKSSWSDFHLEKHRSSLLHKHVGKDRIVPCFNNIRFPFLKKKTNIFHKTMVLIMSAIVSWLLSEHFHFWRRKIVFPKWWCWATNFSSFPFRQIGSVIKFLHRTLIFPPPFQ